MTRASDPSFPDWHGTTILAVRKNGRTVIAGDGQVSIGQTVIKANAKKVRRIGKGDVIEVFPAHLEDRAWRLSMFGDEIETIVDEIKQAISLLRRHL